MVVQDKVREVSDLYVWSKPLDWLCEEPRPDEVELLSAWLAAKP